MVVIWCGREKKIVGEECLPGPFGSPAPNPTKKITPLHHRRESDSLNLPLLP
jgi:hypothetical protein